VNNVMWYLSRSTGIVAAALSIGALAWGFLFSARATGNRRRPNWWLDLHNWLGGAALVATAAHIVAAYLTTDAGLSLADLFVPGVASSDRLAVAWGVIATYLFATTVFTSWPKRRFSRRTWRIIHLSSVVGVALGLVHAYQMGTEASGRPFRIAMLLMVAIGTYGLSIRLLDVGVNLRSRSNRDATP
jgi:predicted ferric reductase